MILHAVVVWLQSEILHTPNAHALQVLRRTRRAILTLPLLVESTLLRGWRRWRPPTLALTLLLLLGHTIDILRRRRNWGLQ